MLVGRGDLLLFMDADGATLVSDLEKLEAALAAISSGQCALAFSSVISQRKLQVHLQCHVPSTVHKCQGHAGNTAGQGSVGQKKNSTRIGLGIAAGSRAHLEGRALSQRSWSRNLLMHGFHLLVLLVAGGAIKDTQCGFKVRLSSAVPYTASHFGNFFLWTCTTELPEIFCIILAFSLEW